MQCVATTRALPASDPLSLIDLDLPAPQPGPHDLLVRVQAVSVNPADMRMRLRKADDGRPAVLGWDVAGEVIATGSAATGFHVGDAVYYAGDLQRPGGNSALHAVDAALVGHRPRTLGAAEAAALPLTALTAWEALFEHFGLPAPDLQPPAAEAAPRTLLIVGGAGGVGSIAIQLARQVPGLTVIATASRPASRDWCLRMGAHAVVDHFADLPAQCAALGHPHIDLALLLHSPDRHFPALAALLAPRGRLCCAVPFDTPPDLNTLMRKSASLHWEFMFTRSLFGTADKARQGAILNVVAALVDAGRLASTATTHLGPLSAQALRQAHIQLEQGRTVGKIVLGGFPDTPMASPPGAPPRR